jgi:hypothetical protein
VVGVQQEQQVQRLGGDRVDLVLLGRHAEGHAQEVVDVAERVVGVQERLPDRLLVGVRRDGRHLGHEAHRRHLDVLVVERVQAVLVEGRQRAHGRRQHGHRVGVGREAAEELAEVLVQHRVLADLGLPAVELVRGRQLAVDEQPGDLEEAGLLGELLDRVAAVAQDAASPSM